jgi:hypothetical protein
MTSAGMFIFAIISFEVILFACLTAPPVAGAFCLKKANLFLQLLPEKISEGE